MRRRAQWPTPVRRPLAGAAPSGSSGDAADPAREDTEAEVGPAWRVIGCRFAAAAPLVKHGAAALHGARWRLATLALLALSVQAVPGQPVPVAPPASAASAAAAPTRASVPPASAASGRGRNGTPPFRGSQSEAMQACRSLPGEQAQHDCMLHHQAMPPYGADGGPSGPPRRRP